MSDKTGEKQGETKFQPGQSGNPKGRPAGSRNKLGEEFIEALQADFKDHGKEAIIKVRTEKPDQYLKVIASIVPKDLNVNINNFDGLSDDELRSELRDLAATLAALVGDVAGEGDSEGTGAPQTH
jgi:hypothetical protein